MSRTDEEMSGPANFGSDRSLWRRCQVIDMPEDEAARFLDLAAFADRLLDDEERDCVAAQLAADPVAAADVAAARALSRGTEAVPAGLERIIARAEMLVGDPTLGSGRVLPFLAAPHRPALHLFAQWGSLAAALAVASWLGFAMGSGASLTLSQAREPSQMGEASFLPELLDPTTGFLRDLGEGQET
jgi:hypothetical protein